MKTIQYISLSVAITLTSCISEQSVVQTYYTIEWPDLTGISPVDPTRVIRGSCEIEPVKINAVYDRKQIVNRSDSHEITFYRYHQWAVRPSVSITELMKDYMVQKQIFQIVSSRYSRGIPDYRLETQVIKLEVVEEKNLFSAHVQMDFRIVNSQDNSILISHRLNRKELLGDKDLNLFAEAVINILFNELEVFSTLIQVELSGQEN